MQMKHLLLTIIALMAFINSSVQANENLDGKALECVHLKHAHIIDYYTFDLNYIWKWFVTGETPLKIYKETATILNIIIRDKILIAGSGNLPKIISCPLFLL